MTTSTASNQAPSVDSSAGINSSANRSAEARSTEVSTPVIRRLPNGLTIIAEQMPIDAVNLSLWLNIGSRVESDAINGMAHFLEHMIFKGTPELKCGEFERLTEERGAVMNAATSQDYTHYYITTAPQDFATLAPLQIELVLNPSLANEHFERERPVILEEIRRAEDSPQRRMFYRAMTTNFERLPYRRPVLGPTTVIEQLTAEQMRLFHRTWYQPQNMTAVVVGNLPVESLMQVVEDSFEQALARRETESACDRNQVHNASSSTGPSLGSNALLQVPSTSPEDPFTQVHRAEYVDDALQQSRLLIGWRVPGMCDVSRTYPLDVASSVLSYGRSARLVSDLREQRHLVNSVSASNMSFSSQGMFYISAQVSEEAGAVEAAEAAILEHVQRMHDELITADELRRVQTQVANRYVFGSETPSDRANLYGYYQAMTGDIHHALDYPDWIRRVSADDVRTAVRQYLPLDAYSVVVSRPAPPASVSPDSALEVA